MDRVESTARFGGCLLTVGIFLSISVLFSFFYSYLPTQQAEHYIQGSCTILSKKMVTNTDQDGSDTYSPSFTYKVWFDDHAYPGTEYEAASYESSHQNEVQAILDKYTVGERYPCWYNPANPTEAVLQRTGPDTSFWWLVGITVTLVLLGGALLLYARWYNGYWM